MALFRDCQPLRASATREGLGYLGLQMTPASLKPLSDDLEPGDLAAGYGAVVAVRKSKLTVFFDLRYLNGLFQIAAERSSVSDAEWSSIRSIRQGDRMYAEGIIRRTLSGALTLFVSKPPLAVETFISDTLAATRHDFRSIAARLVIAELRVAAESFFNGMGYTRVDTRVVSASWPRNSETSVHPVQVYYVGFGDPVYLAPSPSPQLVDALIISGAPGVYASTSSFTTSYRQPTDAVETAIVAAKTLDIDLEELGGMCVGLMSHVQEAVFPDQSSPTARPGWDTKRFSLPGDSPQQVDVPRELWVMDVESGPEVSGSRVIALWYERCLAIEASAEQVAEDAYLSTLVFHPERLLAALQQTPIRTLQHLGSSRRSVEHNEGQ